MSKTRSGKPSNTAAKAISMGFALVVFFFCILPSATAEEMSPWIWTADNPKPIWWDWGESYSKDKPVRGGIYHIASPLYVGLMNPNHWPVNDWVAMTYIYEYLIGYDGFMPTVNWLIENWKYTGPTSAVLTFRKGIRFHDGTDLDAVSYKYQLDWIKSPANGAWSRYLVAPIKSTTVVDRYTLNLEFTKPWASFAGVMANVPGYAISKKALEGDVALREMVKVGKKAASAKKKIGKLEDKANKQSASKARKTMKKVAKAQRKLAALEKKLAVLKKATVGAKPLDRFPVSTGKFMLEEGRPGNYLKLKRNPDWWFGKSIGKPEMPYFDGILIKVIPDPSVRLANFRAGKIDSINIDRSQYNLLKRDPNTQLYTYVNNHLAGLRINHAKGPTKDIRVRKAISHAIDRKALIAGTQFFLAVEASCMFPSVHWGHNPDLKPVRYDPELSKRLLAEAGYAGGLSLKGNIINLSGVMTWSTAVKNMLQKVGIDWQYDVLDSVANDDRMKNLEYDLAQGGWAWILDPDVMASGTYHPDGNWNRGRYDNPEITALIEKARIELDLKKRQQLYWQIEEAVYNDYADVWLWWPKGVSTFRKPVRGWNQEHYLAGRGGQWQSHCRWFKDGKR
ncbi:MAG: ABC transporter substrate-binding protein [Proteobacteria bacterium]|nr:ABC transporter substrate-binding protein [Pseudomonadota bacterium]